MRPRRKPPLRVVVQILQDLKALKRGPVSTGMDSHHPEWLSKLEKAPAHGWGIDGQDQGQKMRQKEASFMREEDVVQRIC